MDGFSTNRKDANSQADIRMEKEKNLLIFTRNCFDYKVAFDLNTGKYFKIYSNGKERNVKNINSFFVNVFYDKIINEEDYPIYFKIIQMAGRKSAYATNMGSVLSILRHYLFWEKYLVLNLPINSSLDEPLSFFPKDVFNIIKRAISLSEEYNKETIQENGWYRRSLYYLPTCFSSRLTHNNKDIFFNMIRYCGTKSDNLDFVEIFNIVYNEGERLERLICDYNYEYKSLLEYILFLIHHEGYTHPDDAAGELKDYISMVAKIAEYCGRPGKFEKYPRHLASRHKIACANYNIIKQKMDDQIFKSQYNGCYNYKDKKYCIIEPESTKDILKEAEEMRNCVASYISKIIRGSTKIVLMRSNKDIDSSLVTVEIKNNCVCQFYQKSNEKVTKEQYDFLCKFAKNKKLSIDKM